MAEQPGLDDAQSPSGGSADSSSDDDDGVTHVGIELVPSFDLDAAGMPTPNLAGERMLLSSRNKLPPMNWAKLIPNLLSTIRPGQLRTGPAAWGGVRHFDPNTAAQHRYLGDVDELGGGSRLLEEGATYTLPLFPLEGVVLLPGENLPLFLHSPQDVLKLERALRLPPGAPTARLIAVVGPGTHTSWRSHMSLVGCTAEIRRLRRHTAEDEQAAGAMGAAAAVGGTVLGPERVAAAAADGNRGGGAAAAAAAGRALPSMVAVVARGRQRLLIDLSALTDTFRVRVKVLPEGMAERPPRQLAAGAAFWSPWAARLYDVPALAGRVQELCSGVLPQRPQTPPHTTTTFGISLVAAQIIKTNIWRWPWLSIASKFGPSTAVRGPLALQRYGYWLASNLPLSAERRQLLLECRDAAERLRLMSCMLTRLGTLACKVCGSQVTRCSWALLMSSEGAGGAFVNAHGYVHDIATFRFIHRAVQRLSYQGQPETAYSWFPGYAWTIANCTTCGNHLLFGRPSREPLSRLNMCVLFTRVRLHVFVCTAQGWRFTATPGGRPSFAGTCNDDLDQTTNITNITTTNNNNDSSSSSDKDNKVMWTRK
ncbi:hypothetical protein VOLCADRAFT_89116 [Volvox carteri f. nagariensis]|uniref:CULT domain-containing protein n=1 Tax=Volvox carteri f. nagariensis TaxID=3068 RepID=D8TQU6_VOLCA|nr:uncharacterized protein VOLCADRAFT_89116 [Volvox carteri f. nagariensis]EFJ50215.1 hypothetical protein VOLCADRAFT_89116 [Volvox carteri f. nagariensis]|eukprot:XP_002948835.1 hypothetical protein VOLCADRAFT_89116 [Volvox carteri f. nagariensis]